MHQRRMKPAPHHKGTGFEIVHSHHAIDSFEHNLSFRLDQAPRAAVWLARRAHLPIATAHAIAAANMWGVR